MIRTKVFCDVTDSDAAPFITQKNVVLCRSGIQLYHRSELAGFMSDGNKPAVEKEWYKEYRPANVVVKAKDKCRTLPVTKEHPEDWVTPDSFSSLAGGVTDKEVEVIALEGESEGEIGLSTSLTFFTKGLYEYYLQGNREVSLGYRCIKEWVPNPEEVGYDIILVDIIEVNHVAVTRSGRGGSSVAVADSVQYSDVRKSLYDNKTGGKNMLRTNIFSWLCKKQTDSKFSFGETVISALKSNKETSDETFAEDYKAVLDSFADFKDSTAKQELIDTVHDCADNREKALKNKDELVKVLDSMFDKLSEESAKANPLNVSDSKDEEKKEEKEEAKDSEEEKKEDSKDSDKKDEEKEEKKDEDKDSEKKDEKKDGCGSSKDSALKDELIKAVVDSVKDSVKEIAEKAVKETLGIKDSGKKDVEGASLDSEAHVSVVDYADFLD